MLNKILKLDKNEKSPKTLIVLAGCILIMSVLPLFKAFVIFIVLYAFLLVFSIVKLVIKSNYVYIATILIIVSQISEQLYFYFTGSTGLALLWSIFLYVGLFVNLVVLLFGVYRLIKKMTYSANVVFVIINVLVVVSMVFISMTYTMNYSAIDGGQMFHADGFFMYIFFTFMVYFIMIVFSGKALRKENKEIKFL